MIEINSSHIISKHNSSDDETKQITYSVSIHKVFRDLFKFTNFNSLPESVFEIEQSLWRIIDDNVCDTISEADNNRIYKIREIT